MLCVKRWLLVEGVPSAVAAAAEQQRRFRSVGAGAGGVLVCVFVFDSCELWREEGAAWQEGLFWERL